MTIRYWVIGGEYEDQDFVGLRPESRTISGPYADALKARTEWTRLTFRDGCGAMTRYHITEERHA